MDKREDKDKDRACELAGLLLGADVAAGVNQRDVQRHSEVVDEPLRRRTSYWKRCMRSLFRMRRRTSRFCMATQRRLAAMA